MSHYLVYVPGEHCRAARDQTTAGILQHVGLSDHAAGAFTLATAAQDSPDGRGGTLFAWQSGTAAHRLHYRADEQEWLPAVAKGDEVAKRYWLGFWKDSPVRPGDIRRSRSVPGHEVFIGGEPWVVPDPQLLPHVMAPAEDGSWRGEVVPEYHEHWSTVVTLRNSLLEGNQSLADDRLYDFCLQSLQVNYRLTREVVGHLKLFTTDSVVTIGRRALGLPVEQEA